MTDLVVPGCTQIGLGLVNAFLVDSGGDSLVLIDAGARVDTTNCQGMSALTCSRQADSNAMYELLLRHSN